MKRYKIVDDHDGSDVLGGAVAADNAYVSLYGSILDEQPLVSDLAVGESTLARFALSRQPPVVYRIVRVEDE